MRSALIEAKKDNAWNRATLSELMSMLAKGQIKPVIGPRVPFAKVKRAHELVEQGEVIGKVALLGEIQGCRWCWRLSRRRVCFRLGKRPGANLLCTLKTVRNNAFMSSTTLLGCFALGLWRTIGKLER